MAADQLGYGLEGIALSNTNTLQQIAGDSIDSQILLQWTRSAIVP